MSKILSIITCFVFPFVLMAQKNPIAYYTFNQTAIDYSGNNNNGKIKGGVIPTKDRFGNPCGALNFNGFDGFIEVPNSQSLSSPTNEFSICVWFKIEENKFAVNGLNWLTLICKGDSPTETLSNPHYRAQSFQGNTQSTISINTEFTEHDFDFKNHLFPFDKWAFYALVYDGTKVRCYLNRTIIWEQPLKNQMLLTSNNAPLHIAKDIPGATEFFKGDLDDLRIYSQALSHNEVLSVFNDNSGANYTDEFSLKCPQKITVNPQIKNCKSIVNYNEPIVDVVCGSASLTKLSGLPSGSSFPIGKHKIKYQAINQSGLVKTCSFFVNVIPINDLEISCENDTTIFITQPSLNVKKHIYKMPDVNSYCANFTIVQNKGLKSGKSFPIGTNEIGFEVKNEFGLVKSCSFNINVIKNVVPVATQSTPVVTQSSPVISQTNSAIVDKTPIVDSLKNDGEESFKTAQITMVIYDNKKLDNDTVSVFFNGEEIIKREMIFSKKYKETKRIVTLNKNKENIFIVKAWNVGSIPPNTIKVDFYEGQKSWNELSFKRPKVSRTIRTEPGIGAVIKMNYEK